jgi:hypothetical protein
MAARLMSLRPLISRAACVLLLAAGAAQAQQLSAPQPLGRAAGAPVAALDAAEAPMLAMPSTAGTFQAWYAANGRPALVVYFDRKLEELPAGWHGTSRLVIDDNKVAGGKEENRRVTIGVQHADGGAAPKSQFALLFEQAVRQEMKRQNLRLLDASVLQRRESARAHGPADIEYAALRGSARFVFEVALVGINNQWELVGELKDVASGELTATVRHRIDGPLATPADLDRAGRALVQQLLRYRQS